MDQKEETIFDNRKRSNVKLTSKLKKQSLDQSIDSLRESHISLQRSQNINKNNYKTRQHQLNRDHLEKNRHCCGVGCTIF